MKSLHSDINCEQIFLTYYGLINAIPQEYYKGNKANECKARASYTTMENLKVLTTKTLHKSFVMLSMYLKNPPQKYDLLPIG